MLERVYYLFITSFIPVDWLVPVLAGILMILLLIYHIIGKPFTAKSENILEIFGRIVNMCSLAIDFNNFPISFELFESKINDRKSKSKVNSLFV